MPWALEESKLLGLFGLLELKAAGGNASEDVLAAIRSENAASAARGAAMAGANNSGSIFVLPLFGLMSYRASMMNDISGGARGTSLDAWTAQFKQALNDPRISAIVIVAASPGGSVDGCQEAADLVFSARGKKPVTAIADTTAASACFWVISGASEIVVTPSGQVGSIGVFCAHEDDSEALKKQGVKVSLISAGAFKTEGNAFQPLGDEARAAMQGMVDDYYGMFARSVARGRGVSVADVRGGMGQGRMVTAQRAVALKMADRVGTLDSVLAKYGISSGGGNTRALAAPGISAQMQRRRDQLRIAQAENIEVRAANFGSARDRGHGGGF
jgi:signal peptide peptidase SppA